MKTVTHRAGSQKETHDGLTVPISDPIKMILLVLTYRVC